MLALLEKYFPELSPQQKAQFEQLHILYQDWNSKINLISRKDMENWEERHLIHSLSLAKITEFKEYTQVLDVGTGGGFPGIPLAILFPWAKFHLVDSIGKKIKVVAEISQSLGLENVSYEQNRAENLHGLYDFVISRAVAPTLEIIDWTKRLIVQESFNSWRNGWILWKGGDLSEELYDLRTKPKVYELSQYFEEPFFETKKIIYIKASFKA